MEEKTIKLLEMCVKEYFQKLSNNNNLSCQERKKINEMVNSAKSRRDFVLKSIKNLP